MCTLRPTAANTERWQNNARELLVDEFEWVYKDSGSGGVSGDNDNKGSAPQQCKSHSSHAQPSSGDDASDEEELGFSDVSSLLLHLSPLNVLMLPTLAGGEHF